MKGETITIIGDHGALGAYLAHPPHPAPGVVVFQEIFGVNAYVRGVCDWLAQAGYAAIAPDLYRRQEPGVELAETERERATQLMQGLDHDLALEDGRVALRYLKSSPVSGGKVAALGFCLGGKFAYLMSTDADVAAAVSYYGVGIQAVLGEAANIRAPLLMHMGADDALCSPAAQKQITDALAPLGERVSIHVYPGVGHAFARRGGAPFNAEAAALADERTLAFLARHLA